ncbi:trigger factor [Thioclava sp. BHET1]|nr:trigger factor [Thioclava sp. BHET1]
MELSDFLGDWDLTRTISHADGTHAQFSGQAVFTPQSSGLLYRETGVLVLPGGYTMQAERRYRWHAEAGGIAVSFEDGRPFHRFDLATPRAAHWCDPDSYTVDYDFLDWPAWRAQWQVRGPRKDYVMHSAFTRA